MIRFGSMIGGAMTLAIMLGCYSVSLKVSGERKAVDDLRGQIASDMRGIRTLQAEYRTRARPSELQRWNDEALGLQAAAPMQFVRDPVELAAFEARSEAPVARYAVATAPAPAPAPVTRVAYAPAAPADAIGELVETARTAVGTTATVQRVALQRVGLR